MTTSDLEHLVLPANKQATVEYLQGRSGLRVIVTISSFTAGWQNFLNGTLTPSAWRAFTDMFDADSPPGLQAHKWYSRSSHAVQRLMQYSLVCVDNMPPMQMPVLRLTDLGALVREQLPLPPAPKIRPLKMTPTNAEIECLKNWPRYENYAIPLNENPQRECVPGRWTTGRNGATYKLARMVRKGLLEMGLGGVRINKDGAYEPDGIPELRFRPTVLGALLGGDDQ